MSKVDKRAKSAFTMPSSLRWRTELASAGINHDGMHLTDIISLIYGLRISNAEIYLERKRQERMHERGISEIRTATEKDFDEL